MMKDSALQVGVKLANKIGLINVSQAEICKELNIPVGSWLPSIGCSFTDFITELKALCLDPKNVHPIVKKRVNPALRKEHILEAAMTVAVTKGYANITREDVAEAAGVSTGTVSQRFGTMGQLRNDLVRRAIKSENLKIVAQAIADGNRYTAKIDTDLKTRALQCLM